MAKFTVEIHEVHHSIIELEAPKGATHEQLCDAAEAKSLRGESLNLEWSHDLPKEQWTVRDDDGNLVPDR